VCALLGGEELSDANLLAHLGIIEQRTHEVLQVRLRHWRQRLAAAGTAADIGCTAVDSGGGWVSLNFDNAINVLYALACAAMLCRLML
jgi:hypothetical protein